jgi:transcriptional regulator with XRE-family HTH domain
MVEVLGARIKRLRQERELTLQAVADELDLTPAAISHWESGRITPKPRKLQELAKALKVSVGELTGSAISSAKRQQTPMTDIDSIISDAQEQIAKKMGCSRHRVRLVLSIEPS